MSDPTLRTPPGLDVRATDPTVATPGGAASDTPALLPGAVLGAYRIVAHLGRGGMGDVYRARDEALEREVALKTIARSLGADPSFVLRFKEEAKAAARLSHPHLVQVHSFGEQSGTLYFAMELVAGKSLGERLRDGPVPWREAARFAAQAARGLEAAASQGIIHRDVKPENLLVGADGTVKVADFGLAKRLEGDGAHTASGVIVGTPRYMSPEQAQGEALDFRSDIYSLGATLFHLVAGRPVFDGATAMKLCMKHISEPPPALASVSKEVPEALSQTVARMLAKRREERHASYAVLIADLEAIASASSASAVTLVTPPPAAPSSGVKILNIVKRPDGGVEVGLNCPVTTPVTEPVKKARASAPLAPRWRRFLADIFDASVTMMFFAFLGLIPWPWHPFPPIFLALAMGFIEVQAMTRRGGTLGERLFQVRLVNKNGGLPTRPAVGVGWFFSKGTLAALVMMALAYQDLKVLIGNEPRLHGCAVGLSIPMTFEYLAYLATGLSVRDRMFKTRVVDVQGLPDQDEDEES